MFIKARNVLKKFVKYRKQHIFFMSNALFSASIYFLDVAKQEDKRTRFGTLWVHFLTRILRYVRKDYDLFISLEVKRRRTTCREEYLDLTHSLPAI